MKARLYRWCAGAPLLLAGLLAGAAHAGIAVRDDAGQRVVLAHPAARIVSLAPAITELLFAAGAGRAVVGVSAYSDYPAAARALPRVGGAAGLDLEAIVALHPDLIVAWKGGNPPAALHTLRALGYPLYLCEPRRLGDIPSTLARLGRLAGTEAAARRAAAAYDRRLQALSRRYRDRAPVTVFFQVWDHPLMTVNGQSPISDAIRLCGGVNIFAGLPALAPQVDTGAVLASDPQVIIAGGSGARAAAGLAAWRSWPQLAAVRAGNLYTIPADLIERPGPRILDGATRLCVILAQARSRR